ncbi:MAG TPA: universal stress protein [Candidatus Limnocylindria bacterium]|nr:universal stress protein [Candidatus Limnocylindria bacterium]
MRLTNILVPLAGTAIDPDVIEYAIALGRPHKAKITAVHVIEVRWNMPLDAVLDAELERGEEILSLAEKVAEKQGAHVTTEVLQAREAAAAIVDTAVEQGCELIIVGMPFRKRLGRVYVGRTVESVYVKAPCAVLAYRQEQPK